uniref:ATPase family AAA domain-containing protein 3-like n=1 Tax=Hirondellea gigas TaxID=1518452 RepID=A0A2P2HWM6_9CRUS
MSMSWLWGGNKQPPLPNQFNDFVPPTGGTADGGASGGGGGDDDKNKDGAMKSYRFDSSALERAAEAAKSLEQNPNAKECLELSRQQEITKQNVLMKEMKQYEVHIKQAEIERERARGEEEQKLLKEKAVLERQKSLFNDKLTRQRNEDTLEAQRRLNEENLRKQEESVVKQEAIRRSTLEHELEKRAQMDIKRIEQEVLSKGKVERDNHDLTLEQIRLKAKEDRETRMESIKSIGALVGSGLHIFLGDQQRVQMAVGGLVVLTAGYFTAKGALGIAFRFLEARLVKPTLVRETSRLSLLETMKHPIDTVKKIRWRLKGSQDTLKGVILKPNVEAAIRDIALETRNCRKAKGIYRNVLLHGPPGTGKTLFAKKLARNSGMDYAIMTGGDVQLMGDKSVEAIHKLFDWARTSRRGLILFIDEAESFLIRRHSGISQNLRDTMAAFLSHTGDHSDRFMMILTSNIPTVFDEAVINRIHDAVEFGLPELAERTQLVGHYFEEYILKPAATGKWRIKLDQGNWTDVCKEVAKLTEGMSGREIAHLALDWQMKTIVTEKGELTKELMIERTMVAMERKKKTLLWKKAQQDEQSQFSSALVDAVKAAAASAPLHQKNNDGSPTPSAS